MTTSTKPQELLPCPFCGATPKRVNNGMVYDTWPVACAQDGCPVRGLVIQISQWETRSGSQGVVDDAMVERLTIQFFNQTLGVPSWSKMKNSDRAMAILSMREVFAALTAALGKGEGIGAVTDPSTVAMLKRSIQEAKDGKLVDRGSFAHYAHDAEPPATISEEGMTR